MNRISIHLSTRQLEKLQEEADKLGIKRAELVRRILDKWIEENRK